MKNLVLLGALLTFVACVEEMDYIPDNWVDPSDMRRYDRNSKSMKTAAPRRAEKYYPVESTAVCLLPRDEEACDCEEYNRAHRFEIFIERFVNQFLRAANLNHLQMKEDAKKYAELRVRITGAELKQLKAMGEEFTADKLDKLDKIFSDVLLADRDFTFENLVSYANPLEQMFEYLISREKATILVLCISFLYTLYMFAMDKSWIRIMFFLFLVMFLGGLAWNWWYLYQVAVVKAFVESNQNVPGDCDPRNMTWMGYVKSFFVDSSDCSKYYEASMIDPFSRVSPSVVFSETLSAMFIHPMGKFGHALGDFFRGISKCLPWPLNVFLMPFVVLAAFAFALCCWTVTIGKSLKFWTIFGGIQIGGREPWFSNGIRGGGSGHCEKLKADGIAKSEDSFEESDRRIENKNGKMLKLPFYPSPKTLKKFENETVGTVVERDDRLPITFNLKPINEIEECRLLKAFGAGKGHKFRHTIRSHVKVRKRLQ